MEELFPNYIIKQQGNSKYYQITNIDEFIFIVQKEEVTKCSKQMQIIHDNYSIIVDFLKLNGFIKHKYYYYLSYKDNDICVHIYPTMCLIKRKHSEYHCTFDEFFPKLKEMLDLEYLNKSVIDMY